MRAFLWPYFFRSTMRASRVRKPPSRRAGSRSGRNSFRARARPSDDGARLAVLAAALDVDEDVDPAGHLGGRERGADVGPLDLEREVGVDFQAVDQELAGALRGSGRGRRPSCAGRCPRCTVLLRPWPSSSRSFRLGSDRSRAGIRARSFGRTGRIGGDSSAGVGGSAAGGSVAGARLGRRGRGSASAAASARRSPCAAASATAGLRPSRPWRGGAFGDRLGGEIGAGGGRAAARAASSGIGCWAWCGWLRADVELQLGHHVAADLVLRHHPLDGQLQGSARAGAGTASRRPLPSGRRGGPSSAGRSSAATCCR